MCDLNIFCTRISLEWPTNSELPKHANPSKVLQILRQISLSYPSAVIRGIIASITLLSTIFILFVAETKSIRHEARKLMSYHFVQGWQMLL